MFHTIEQCHKLKIKPKRENAKDANLILHKISASLCHTSLGISL